MGNGYGGALAGIAGASLIAIVLIIIVCAAAAALGIWIVYTIIWRAVRRGLREYYQPTSKPAAAPRPSQIRMPDPGRQPGPRDW